MQLNLAMRSDRYMYIGFIKTKSVKQLSFLVCWIGLPRLKALCMVRPLQQSNQPGLFAANCFLAMQNSCAFSLLTVLLALSEVAVSAVR